MTQIQRILYLLRLGRQELQQETPDLELVRVLVDAAILVTKGDQ